MVWAARHRLPQRRFSARWQSSPLDVLKVSGFVHPWRMEETITMSAREQRRAWVLSRVEAGEMGVAEAAGLLGLTERSYGHSTTSTSTSLAPRRARHQARDHDQGRTGGADRITEQLADRFTDL
jgi:hypothetical protein